jgi:hypothetical protein
MGRPYNEQMADSLGNAFHRLRAYVHPHVKHVITQTLEQANESDFWGSEQGEHMSSSRENPARRTGGSDNSFTTGGLKDAADKPRAWRLPLGRVHFGGRALSVARQR